MADADNTGNKTEKERVWASLKAKLNAPPAPPLAAAKKFFRSYFADESWEEAKEGITSQAAENPRTVLAGFVGVEGLLADLPTKRGVLSEMVAWDANWVLEDRTDEGAKVWLRDVTEMVREILGDKQPPRPKAD